MAHYRGTVREEMYARIAKHGADLNRIFNTGIDDIQLCKKVYRLEQIAHKLATDYCNGETDNWEAKSDAILVRLDKILNFRKLGIPVFLNRDARGYALKLKIDSDYVEAKGLHIHRDLGGYGIIAPDLS